MLIPPAWDRPFRVHIDASQTEAGATLTHLDDSECEWTIAYTSCKLMSAESNYTSNERELLGLVFALLRFHCYLEGSSFDVITDNQVI